MIESREKGVKKRHTRQKQLFLWVILTQRSIFHPILGYFDSIVRYSTGYVGHLPGLKG